MVIRAAGMGEDGVKRSVGSPSDHQPMQGSSSSSGSSQVHQNLLLSFSCFRLACYHLQTHCTNLFGRPRRTKPVHLQESTPAVSAESKPAVSGEKKSMQDYESYPKDFVRRRLVVFVGIVIG